MRQQGMSFIADVVADAVPLDSTFELLRVVWMEVAIAAFAAIVYFTFSGLLSPKLKKPCKSGKLDDVEDGRRNKTVAQTVPCDADSGLCQLVNKALRQGKISEAIASLRAHPKVATGVVPANVAPRLLMAAAKAPNFNEVMIEMRDFVGKIEPRSIEAVVTEATKNKDIETCRRLQLMSGLLSVSMSKQTFEVLAQAYSADAVALRSLVEECKAPLSRTFAKLVLEVCTKMKDIDLAAEVFEKVADSDAPFLRKIVERSATHCVDYAGDAAAKDACLRAKEIRACGKNGDLQAALDIFEQQPDNSSRTPYNAILEACVACGDLDRALEIFSKAKQEELADVVSYNTVMKVHVAQGNVSAAKALLAEISARGLSPTHASFHTLLNFLSSAGDRNGVWNVLTEMQKAGVSPNSVTCSILLKGKLNSASDVDTVLRIIKKLEEPLDEVLFSSLAEACIRTRKLEVLTEYMSTFSAHGNANVLSAPTYGSMIKAYGQMHDVKRVKELWGDMVRHGVQPTAITLGCMVEALVMNKRTSDAWALVLELRSDQNTAPLLNTVIYSTILKGFANSREIDKVMAIYAEMKVRNIQSNTITYNTILNAFAQGGAMHRAAVLLEDMKSADPPVEPDIVTYSTLVKGFSNSGDLDRALCILKDMQDEGKNSPDEVMYNSILDGCCKAQRLEDALKLFGEMKQNGIAPSNYTLSIMVKLLGRGRRLKQALALVEEVSNEFGVKPNIQVYTCLIQACFNNRQASKAIALHDKIIEEGLFPDEMTYSALVKGCLQASLVDKAVHLVKCAHGVAHPRATGRPAGVSARCLDDVISALGGKHNETATSLLVEIGKLSRQVTSNAMNPGRVQNKTNDVGAAPWRKRRD
jgi:pentatricopeptide repeat protein